MENSVKIMEVYAELHLRARQIILYLLNDREYFEGGYSDLTRELGFEAYKQVSNIRRVIIALVKFGVLEKTSLSKTKFRISLVDDWQSKLLNMYPLIEERRRTGTRRTIDDIV